MRTIEKLNKKINSAKSLENLLEILKTNETAIRENQIDCCDLPTFGGIPPKNTSEIWSWDKKNLLVGRCIREFEIISR